MAHQLGMILFFFANEPYYWPEQTNVLSVLKTHFSDLNDCEPKDVGHSLAISLNIDSTGSVISIEMENQKTYSCITDQMRKWTFLEHREETAVVHFALTVRESKYFLLPGSYVEQRQVKQRYWMHFPDINIAKDTVESSASESSDHFIEDQ